MHVPFRRLYADEYGMSHMETVESELAVSEAAALPWAPFTGSAESLWIGAPKNWATDEPHPAPRRMMLLTVRGEYEIDIKDGRVHRFTPGSVLFMEDTTGVGHKTRVTSQDDLILFAVVLPPSYDCSHMKKQPAAAIRH